MNRAWFREKLADKLLFAIIATCVSGIALAQYDLINEKTTYAQRNVDTYIAYDKSNFEKVISAVDASIVQLRLYVLKAEPAPLALKKVIIQTEITLESAELAFARAGVGPNSINTAMSECAAIFRTDEMQPDKVDKLTIESAGPQIKRLLLCRESLLPAFDDFLQRVANASFDNAVDSRALTLGPLRLPWSIAILFVVLLLSSVIGLIWYLRSPETDRAEAVENPMG